MSNTRIPIPSLYGGVSQQPPSIRKADQLAGTVDGCDNATLSVRNGLSKRPASLNIARDTNLSDDNPYRIHAYDRDGDEQYLVVFTNANDTLYIYDTSGVRCYLKTEDINALIYILAKEAEPKDLRFTTVADYTIITNTLVNTGSITGAEYVVTEEFFDADAMFCNYGTDGSYYRTRTDSPGYTAGFWRFLTGTTNTPGKFIGLETAPFGTITPYVSAIRNPGGFNIGVGNLGLPSGNYSWTAATGVLNKTGAFANYTYTAGDYLYVSGGTGVTKQWVAIAGKTDDDNLTFAANAINAANKTDVTVYGVGRIYEIKVNLQEYSSSIATMYDVAARFQDALRDATGEKSFLCAWNYVYNSGGAKGYFTITAPNNGVNSFVGLPFAPTSSIFDWSSTGAGAPFSPGSATKGTGTLEDMPVDPLDRWVRVAPSGQPEVQPDQTKMPVKLTREFLDVVAKYRLDDTSTTARDSVGSYSGTYTGGYTQSVTGHDGASAVTLNGTTGYVSLPTLGTLGLYAVTTGVTVELWVKTTNTSTVNPLFVGGTYGSATHLSLIHNCSDTTSFTHEANSVSMTMFDTAGNGYQFKFGSVTSLADGLWHHVVAIFDWPGTTAKLYIDNVSKTITSSVSLPGTWSPKSFDYARIGSEVHGGTSKFFTGSIDDVVIYNQVLDSGQVNERYTYNRFFYFKLDTIDWKFRETGDEDTNPIPSIIKNEKPITTVAFHRNRLVLGGDTNIVMSQASDFFNLFIEDFNNIGDSDPIDASIGGNQVNIITHAIPFRKGMVIFTQSGQQFELNAPENLTPSTASITPTTSFQAKDVKPVTSGNSMFFVAERGGATQVYEYLYDDSQAASTAAEITSHCDKYVPDNIQTLVAVQNNYCVVALPEDDNSLYVYRYFWADNKKIQSAWSRFEYQSTDVILDIAVIRNDVYMLVKTESGVSAPIALVKQPIPDPDPPTGLVFDPLLDHRQSLTGSYSAGSTTWTFSRNPGTTVVVAGNGFANEGEALTTTSATNTTLVVAGDYSAYPCYIGRPYTMSAELSRPYQRDRNNGSILDANIQLDKLTLNYTDSGAFTVQIEQPSKATRTKVYAPPTGSTLGSGDFQVLVWGNSKDTTVTILSSSHKPCTLTTGEWTATFTPRSQ